ncbi:MAG: hypothetical protein ABSF27_06315 [Candidatus Dormibacteria bacterium]|jgi:hypothetical protein
MNYLFIVGALLIRALLTRKHAGTRILLALHLAVMMGLAFTLARLPAMVAMPGAPGDILVRVAGAEGPGLGRVLAADSGAATADCRWRCGWRPCW